MTTEFKPIKIKLKKNDVLCIAGDKDYDLYYITKGRLMVCVTKATQVIPVAYVDANEYLGELSFFDHDPRSATIIATENTSLIKIPAKELKRQVPKWLISIATFMTKKIRISDEVIKDKGLRKKIDKSIQPLSIEEQRLYYDRIERHAESNSTN